MKLASFFVLMTSLGIMSTDDIVTYEEIKDLPNHSEKLLIDVRPHAEIEEYGSFPATAIVIPSEWYFYIF